MISVDVKNELQSKGHAFISSLKKELTVLSPVQSSTSEWSESDFQLNYTFQTETTRLRNWVEGSRLSDTIIENSSVIKVSLPNNSTDLNRVFIEIRLEVEVQKELSWDGWFGRKTKTVTDLKKLRFVCSPFLLHDEDCHEFLSRDNQVELKDLEEFYKKIKYVNSLNALTLSKIKKVFIDVIESTKKEVESKDIELKSFISELNRDDEGFTLIDSGTDLLKLVGKHQELIKEIDPIHVQKFVKISNYLQSSRGALLKLFDQLEQHDFLKDKNECYQLLKDNNHSYNIISLNAFNMVGSLIKKDLVTFYEINEFFDSLSVFNSQWQNDVLLKLEDVNMSLFDILSSIHQLESTVSFGFRNLSYITTKSLQDLTSIVEKELASIDSGIQFGNIMNIVQTYQLYKINKNTK